MGRREYGKKEVKYDDPQGDEIKEDCTELVELDLTKEEEEGPPVVPDCYDPTLPGFPANFQTDAAPAFFCLDFDINVPPPLGLEVGFSGCVNAAGTGLDSFLNNIRTGAYDPLVFPDCTSNEAFETTLTNIQLFGTVVTQDIIDALNCLFTIPGFCDSRRLLEVNYSEDKSFHDDRHGKDDDEMKEFLQFIDQDEEGGKIRGIRRDLAHSKDMSPPDENFIMFKMAMLADTWNMIDCTTASVGP